MFPFNENLEKQNLGSSKSTFYKFTYFSILRQILRLSLKFMEELFICRTNLVEYLT